MPPLANINQSFLNNSFKYFSHVREQCDWSIRLYVGFVLIWFWDWDGYSSFPGFWYASCVPTLIEYIEEFYFVCVGKGF